jgi:crossover junction endodeoxyribonuclease RusA
MSKIEIRVYGIPRPGGSKKAFYNRKTGKAMLTDAGTHTKDWRNNVRAQAVEAMLQRAPLEGAIYLKMYFYMPRPKGHYRTGKQKGCLKDTAPTYCLTRPDTTKLIRSTEDALTDAGVWRDDAQVVVQEAVKFYADPKKTGALLIVESIDEGANYDRRESSQSVRGPGKTTDHAGGDVAGKGRI